MIEEKSLLDKEDIMKTYQHYKSMTRRQKESQNKVIKDSLNSYYRFKKPSSSIDNFGGDVKSLLGRKSGLIRDKLRPSPYIKKLEDNDKVNNLLKNRAKLMSSKKCQDIFDLVNDRTTTKNKIDGAYVCIKNYKSDLSNLINEQHKPEASMIIKKEPPIYELRKVQKYVKTIRSDEYSELPSKYKDEFLKLAQSILSLSHY